MDGASFVSFSSSFIERAAADGTQGHFPPSPLFLSVLFYCSDAYFAKWEMRVSRRNFVRLI